MTWWFYGCSYTAGHEIHDTAVRNKDGTLTWPATTNELYEQNRKDSWAGTLCKLKNVEFCNRSEYGSSSGRMMMSFLSDIRQHNIDRSDFVVWASTFSRRIFDIQDDQFHTWLPRTLKPTIDHTGTSNTHLLDTWSDTHLLYRWFQDLYQFVTICHHEGYQCMIIPCGDTLQMEHSLLKKKIGNKNEELLKISEYIISRIQSKVVSSEKSFSTFVGDCWYADGGGEKIRDKWYTPGHHPRRIAHDMWAERVYQLLKE